jgi:NAD(P)-dependent dehydrogenase (short-subunit alcohol dehydrogenase family)
MTRLGGEQAVVTGGSSGNGAAIDRLFAGNGGREIVLLGAWLAVGTLAWHTVRLAARARRLEHLTRAWHVAGPGQLRG